MTAVLLHDGRTMLSSASPAELDRRAQRGGRMTLPVAIGFVFIDAAAIRGYTTLLDETTTPTRPSH